MPPPPAAPASTFARLGTPIRVGIAAAGVLVIALVYYFFFYTDLSNAIAAAEMKQTQLQNDEAAAALAYRAFLDDSAKLEEKKARARDLNKALPDTSEIASFLAVVNQQAEIAGLKVRSVAPADEQVQPFYARVPVRLEVSGRFHQLAKFFAGIGRQDRIINVENIEFGSPKVGENEETTLVVKCLTTTFHAVKAAPPAPSGSAPRPAASAAGGAK